jgi:hypothetical protein
MSRHYSSRRPDRRRSQRRSRRDGGCFGRLLALTAFAVILVALYVGFVRPQIGNFIGGQLGQRLVGGSGGVQTQVEQQLAEGVPGIIAALPSGELPVSEQDANAYIAANPQALEPLESATVQFTPGQVSANIQAFGTSSRASAQMSAQDGQLVLTNPQIDGPLNAVVSANSLADSLESQINAELAAQGRVVRDVRIEQGQVVLQIE